MSFLGRGAQKVTSTSTNGENEGSAVRLKLQEFLAVLQATLLVIFLVCLLSLSASLQHPGRYIAWLECDFVWERGLEV